VSTKNPTELELVAEYQRLFGRDTVSDAERACITT
jgi:hypothetical protein